MDQDAGTNLERESGAPEIDAGRGEQGEQGPDELKERIVKVGNNLFKKLVQEFPPKDQVNASCIVNTALFLSCLVQSSLYKPEDRKDFRNIFTETMEKNSNWDEFAEPVEPSEVKPT